MTGVTRQAVVLSLEGVGAKEVNLSRVRSPARLRVAVVAARALGTLMVIGVTVVTSFGQASIVVTDVAFFAI